MGNHAGIKLYNARGSCTLDTECGVTRIVGVVQLVGTAPEYKYRRRIAVPNPNMNHIWVHFLFGPANYSPFAGATAQADIWENRQGFTVKLPLKPNNNVDPEFPDLPYFQEAAEMLNPYAVMFGFY